MGKNNKKHEPTDELRAAIKNMIAFGLPHHEVAKHFNIDHSTLTKYYRNEIDTAVADADRAVYNNLHRLASRGDNPTAAIFWAKCRMRWKEIQQVELTGKDGEALIPSINVTIKGTSGKL
jgi:hypothetical protein